MKKPRGMVAFSVVWLGQLVSLLASAMTGFALPIWAYEKTHAATPLALAGFFYVTPMLLISPIAGAMVDRHNRKLMMMLSDLAAGLGTVVIFILYSNGLLEIWHLYVTFAFQGLFNAFQWPAYSAAISSMLPKEQYGRAFGMMSLVGTAPGIIAPMMAAALWAVIGIEGILLADIVTFIFAILLLLLVEVPQPVLTQEGQRMQGSLLKEASYGFTYILSRPSLLGLQLVFLGGNFFLGLAHAVQAPLILARTDSDPAVFGLVNTLGAAGGFAGGLLMSAWGGPKRRVHGVLSGWVLASLFGLVLLGLGQHVAVWAAAVFLGSLVGPVIDGSNQSIWQSKVPPDLQGRVFSIRRLIAWFVSPLAMALAGPLVDKGLEPAMQAGGALSGAFGWLVGVGPGAGMGLLFVFCGLAAASVAAFAYFVPAVRLAEDRMPDHDQLARVEEPA